MKSLPLLFNYSDTIQYKGDLIEFTIQGRILLTREEDGEVWVYGVNPGGLAGGGETIEEAISNFRNNYRAMLLDMSSEARDMNSLREQVERFIYQENSLNADAWQKAIEEVRNKNISIEGLQKLSAEQNPPNVKIRKLPIPEITDDLSLGLKDRDASREHIAA
ncbi:MAG: hypothetical protein M1491_05040 [Deltaproteobacteria bacterium]|nr:hypothetical protein [Deltaproteobacteria bacterium]MCL5276725.1 hypothetical protein [Deltaproteobacteria bacterium]